MIPAMRSLPSDLCAECWAKIKAAGRAEKERRKEKARPRVEAKTAKRTDRRQSLAEIREWLYSETDGKCAAAGCALDDGWELHHLVSGGMRRARESVATCAPLCRVCHLWAHRNDPDTLRALLAWCQRTGRTEAARELTRRLDKIDEARRATE